MQVWARAGIVTPFVKMSLQAGAPDIVGVITSITIGPTLRDDVARVGVESLLRAFGLESVEVRRSQTVLRH